MQGGTRSSCCQGLIPVPWGCTENIGMFCIFIASSASLHEYSASSANSFAYPFEWKQQVQTGLSAHPELEVTAGVSVSLQIGRTCMCVPPLDAQWLPPSLCCRTMGRQ